MERKKMNIRTKRLLAITSIALLASLAFILVIENSLLENSALAQANAMPTPAPAAFDQAAALAKLRGQIAGKEKEPASSVFKNVQTMKSVPAGRLLSIMEFGYARSLGVNCTHCHTPEKWESDDKQQKQIARDMSAMVGRINGELLKGIKNLKSESPTVNCTTCHRGQVTPALNLSMVVPKP
jgi:hypothetical protein